MTPPADLPGRLSLWALSVFVSKRAAGNPTGVILHDSADAEEVEQRIAQMLGYPDTVFVSPLREGGRYDARTYSPSEPIAFCVQSLLAAAATLQLTGRIAGAVTFRVRGKDVLVTSDEAGMRWVRMNENRRLADLAPDLVHDLVGSVPRVQVVDGGRRRAFVRFGGMEQLLGIEPSAGHVMRFCREQNVNGLCAFVVTAIGEIALRVFTTSLDGREDASTGGAVAGLCACSPDLFADGRPWRVEQGAGPRHRRGTLYVRSAGDGVRIGGAVQPVVRGEILAQSYAACVAAAADGSHV